MNKKESALGRSLAWLAKNRFWLAGLLSVAILAPLVIMALYNKPIADDFYFFSTDTGPLNTAWRFYVGENGRAGYGFFTSLLHQLFGEKAVVVGAILLLVMLIAVSIWLMYTIGTRIIKKQPQPGQSIGLGLTLVCLIILSSYSLFDSFLWLTSSAVYLTSIIGFLFVLTVAIKLFSKAKLAKRDLACLSIVILLSSFFNELTDVYMVGSFAWALIIWFIGKKAKLFSQNRHTSVIVVGLLMTIIGLLLVCLSPGSLNRRSIAGSELSWYAVLIHPIYQMVQLKYLLSLDKLLLVLAMAILLAGVIPKPTIKGAALTVMATAMFILGVGYVYYVVMGYAQNGYTPLRAFIIPGGIILVCTSVIIAILIRTFWRGMGSPHYAAAAAVMVVAMPFTYKTYKPIIQAAVLRQDAFVTRAVDIDRQVRADTGVINVDALPILLSNTDAQDISDNTKQPEWVTKSFKKYYHISEGAELVYRAQTKHYCTNNPGDTPYYFGAKSCGELLNQ